MRNHKLIFFVLSRIIFFTTDSTAFTLNVNIQSADVYPSSGSQYWTLDGVGSANFANLKLRGNETTRKFLWVAFLKCVIVKFSLMNEWICVIGSNTLTIRPYPFSSSYHIRIGLFGVSTIQNGSLEIRDTLPQTGPSFLDVTASVNMSQGILNCSETVVMIWYVHFFKLTLKSELW
jgi:hypothetical protein